MLQSAKDVENKPFKVQVDTEARRLDKAQVLIKISELSHAARALDSNSLAPGTAVTLNDLRATPPARVAVATQLHDDRILRARCEVRPARLPLARLARKWPPVLSCVLQPAF